MLQQQQTQPSNPHLQQCAQSPQREPICVQKLIGKPKQLILQKSINKAYNETWEEDDVDCLPKKETLSSIKTKFNSTELQTRLIGKLKARSAVYRNQKYEQMLKKEDSTIATLKDLQEGGAFGQLVYQRGSKKDNWSWSLKSTPASAENKISKQVTGCIQINSCFESGNLLRAYLTKLEPATYSLITHCDTNTSGYNQWFYFKARCNKPFTTVRFEIVNFRKKYSCFSKGMKIAVFSQQKEKDQKIGWHRGGFNIQYSNNSIRSSINEQLNTLGWDYTFEIKNDWVYFGYSYPYTYTDLRKLITRTKSYKQQAQWATVCLSALKNQVYMIRFCNNDQNKGNHIAQFKPEQKIVQRQQKSTTTKNKRRQLSFNEKNRSQIKSETISNLDSSSMQISQKKRMSQLKSKNTRKPIDEQKQILLIMARAHPGETPSSFIAEGVIDNLLSECDQQIKYLKQKLQIYVIPMLNPDGVVHGNSRVSFTGNDLNRRWKNPHEKLHPEVHGVKEFINDLISKGKKIFAMVDLHAHTKKQSVFLYGCCDHKNYHNRAEVKLLNELMGKCDPNFNSLYSSHFVSQSKRSTARVVFYRQFKCLSYTLEASFLGASEGSFHFSIEDYHKIGRNLLKSLAYMHFATVKNIKSKTNFTINQILLNNTLLKQTLLDYFDRFRRFNNSEEEPGDKQSDGSSSAPSACNFTENQLLANLFTSSQYLNRSKKSLFNYSLQKKKASKYKNEISLSLDDQLSRNSEQLTLSQSPVKMQEPLLAIRKRRNNSKLPAIITVQSKGQLLEDIPQFQAFNFICKSRRYGNKKTLINYRLNGSYAFEPDNTID